MGFRHPHGGSSGTLGILRAWVFTILRYLVMRSAESGYWNEGAGLWVLTHRWLAMATQVSFPVITAFEILSPLVLFSRPFRLVWLVAILMFHLMSYATMQIFFLQNVLLLPVLLLEFTSPESRPADAVPR